MTRRPRQPRPSPESLLIADRLHTGAIRLLRRLRLADSTTGLSAPRLSALSVIVHAGPISIGDLAAREQVQPPTVSRLVKALDREGLVTRKRDMLDERVLRVGATAKGRRVLDAGRRRRVSRLATELSVLSESELGTLERAANLLERLGRGGCKSP